MDTAVSRTDDDALAARASAVKIGYWSDDYIKFFVKSVERKAPVINRGTFVRTRAIDDIVTAFLTDQSSKEQPGKRKQIISLGAGSDTRYFNLAKRYMDREDPIPFSYHELDFPHVCQRKALTLSSKKGMKDVLHYQQTPDIVARTGSIQSPTYNLHPIDLRDITFEDLPGIDQKTETLFISEVCLIYVDVESADKVVDWTASFEHAAVIIYEPIRGDDAFGRMMIKNLAMRGLELKTLEKYCTLKAQEDRLITAGYDSSRAYTMSDIYEKWISDAERERVQGLEMFDEVEEWTLLADHYCVSVGVRGITRKSLAKVLDK